VRNVAKGFQISKIAVPKMHEAKMNSLFLKTHRAPKIPTMRRLPRFSETKPMQAKLPGMRPYRGKI